MKMALGKLLHPSKFFFILWFIVLLTALSSYPPENELGSVNEKILQSLAGQSLSDGDLIFRKGRDLVSDIILTQGDSAQFSHVGMIIKRNDLVYVVHSIPEDVDSVAGVQIEALNSFASFENAVEIAVYRLKNINNLLQDKLKHFVLQQVGKPFDNDFLMSTDDKFYCSELVIKAFATAGIDLTDEIEPIEIMLIDEAVIVPDHLRQSSRFRLLSP